MDEGVCDKRACRAVHQYLPYRGGGSAWDDKGLVVRIQVAGWGVGPEVVSDGVLNGPVWDEVGLLWVEGGGKAGGGATSVRNLKLSGIQAGLHQNMPRVSIGRIY